MPKPAPSLDHGPAPIVAFTACAGFAVIGLVTALTACGAPADGLHPRGAALRRTASRRSGTSATAESIAITDDLSVYPIEYHDQRDGMITAFTDSYVDQWKAVASGGADETYLTDIEDAATREAYAWVSSFTRTNTSAQTVAKLYSIRVAALDGWARRDRRLRRRYLGRSRSWTATDTPDRPAQLDQASQTIYFQVAAVGRGTTEPGASSSSSTPPTPTEPRRSANGESRARADTGPRTWSPPPRPRRRPRRGRFQTGRTVGGQRLSNSGIVISGTGTNGRADGYKIKRPCWYEPGRPPRTCLKTQEELRTWWFPPTRAAPRRTPEVPGAVQGQGRGRRPLVVAGLQRRRPPAAWPAGPTSRARCGCPTSETPTGGSPWRNSSRSPAPPDRAGTDDPGQPRREELRQPADLGLAGRHRRDHPVGHRDPAGRHVGDGHRDPRAKIEIERRHHRPRPRHRGDQLRNHRQALRQAAARSSAG